MARKSVRKKAETVAPKSPKQRQKVDVAYNLDIDYSKVDHPPIAERTEQLIRRNGILVESLLAHEAWPIAQDLILEGIASVSGKFSNGRWHFGADTKGIDDLQFLRGYKKALMDFQNRLDDFIKAKDNLDKKRKEEEAEKRTPLINPFLEEEDE